MESSTIDFMFILVSIVIGFTMNEVFVGWGNILRHTKEKKSLVHIAWTMVVFLALVQFWSSVYNLKVSIEWNLGYFLIVLVPILLLHFLTMFLFPENNRSSDIHLYEHFLVNKKTILFLFASYVMLGHSFDVFFLNRPLISEGKIFTLIVVAIIVGAGFIRNIWFHRVLVSFLLLMLVLTLFQTKIS